MDKLGIVFLAYLFLPLFGAPVAVLPHFRAWTLFSRIAIALLAGTVVLTLEATIVSMAGYAWNPVVLIALALAATWAASRLTRADDPGTPPFPRRPRASEWIAWSGACAALLHLTASIVTTRSTSVDYLFFWGVKAARFADARAIDAGLLRWQFFNHAVPEYPPLVPVTQAWAAIFAGSMPWFVVPLTTPLWIVATAPLLAELLRTRDDPSLASLGTAFWTGAVALSMAYSISGGNAESLLVAFVSIAAASIAAGTSKPGAAILAAVAMAGAVLTKVEAIIPVAGLLLGSMLFARGRILHRIRRVAGIAVAPALALATWFAYQWTSGLPVGYRGHGTLTVLHWENLGSLLAAFPGNLQAGSWWAGWIVPIVVLCVAIVRRRERARAVAPLLLATALMFAFFTFDYLHDAGDPAERIGWTLPRIAQPAMSLVIVAAIAASARGISSEPVPDRPESSG